MVPSNIEVGKTYWTRGKEKVQIIRKGYGIYPFEGSNGKEYNRKGRIDNFSIEIDDLMSEVEADESGFDILEDIFENLFPFRTRTKKEEAANSFSKDDWKVMAVLGATLTVMFGISALFSKD